MHAPGRAAQRGRWWKVGMALPLHPDQGVLQVRVCQLMLLTHSAMLRASR